jgi:3-hydroxymyristoyl/3-hydroxydecanoyl-(acyl carrier protein) dehydratase
MRPPEPTVQQLCEHEFTLTFTLQPHDPCFAGHFDGLPVLAAVVQIGWVMAYAERFLAHRYRFMGLTSNKFLHLVRPPVTLELNVQYRPEHERLQFVYRRAGQVCSRGAIQVQAWS